VLQEILARRAEALAEIIHDENGKPAFEALTCEILPALDLLKYYRKIAPKKLKDRSIQMENPFLRYRRSEFNYWPLGTVAVISPWNYPFFLAFGDIAVAILAGNGVVFKPSEYSPRTGDAIQNLFDEAGFPKHLLQTVHGKGDVGAAIIDQKPAKIFFTGSVRTGKAISKQASHYLIPVSLELGGKDAMLVLPDADLDHATSAALWGGFTNSGQVCASIERLIVHESIAKSFRDLLKEKMSRLSPQTDLGRITMEAQKNIYDEHLKDAKEKGAEFFMGGTLSEDRVRMIPTLVGGNAVENTKIYNEETFGPVIAMTTFNSVQEGIEKVNASAYGLLASVMTKNLALGEEIARELEVGSVLINEVSFRPDCQKLRGAA
jgi:acyl-CoA reductase-like NAD-dependent aldehyde dehydrogenase